MEVRYIFRILAKWFWLIILIPVLAGAGAFYVSVYKTVPVYEAKASMYIFNSFSDTRITAIYGDITSAQNAIRNYGEIVKSQSSIREALDALGLKDYSVSRFSGNVNMVFSDRNSFIVSLSVMDSDPKLASDMANKLSEQFVEKTDRLMQMPVIKILDRAAVPTVPSNDDTRKNVGLSILAGIMFCAVIIFFIEYAGSVVIRNGEDIVKYLGIPVLAAIPDMKHIKTLL
ncbi:MAG TPA: Wzz/FepE/Etk N-terminal domain-containing protein [Clostridia bacterium]|nr:Wzz/FepE/Etk N-terminal domain-containing protein [Clostridia bacterium]